jgi:hypothetical protein
MGGLARDLSSLTFSKAQVIWETMILSTHAVVGGAIASLMPSHPVLAFVVGVASHYAIDAIPHVDYQSRG